MLPKVPSCPVALPLPHLTCFVGGQYWGFARIQIMEVTCHLCNVTSGKIAVTQLRNAAWGGGGTHCTWKYIHKAFGTWLVPTMVVVPAALSSHSLILSFAFSLTVQQ